MKTFLYISFFFSAVCLNAQSIVGEWYTIDEKTQEQKAIVEIYKSNNAYFGKITNVLLTGGPTTCTACSGNKKGQAFEGLVIIENIQKDGDEYNDGTILDPESGTEYKCLLRLEDNNKLKVRGYIGFALLGRTQYWRRKS